MLIERLDRTDWTLGQAQSFVSNQLYALIIADHNLATQLKQQQPYWRPSQDEKQIAENLAGDELLNALRNGDLPAKGRLSTDRVSWASDLNSGWVQHSGHYGSITIEHWRGGHLTNILGSYMLTFRDGQFIDILVPKFVVVAIWTVLPDKAEGKTQSRGPEAGQSSSPAALSSYRTPYLDLLERAIIEWNISHENQPKKDNLVDWFRAQSVDGEPLSENLANSLATLVRLPSSQRGGARRGGGG